MTLGGNIGTRPEDGKMGREFMFHWSVLILWTLLQGLQVRWTVRLWRQRRLLAAERQYIASMVGIALAPLSLGALAVVWADVAGGRHTVGLVQTVFDRRDWVYWTYYIAGLLLLPLSVLPWPPRRPASPLCVVAPKYRLLTCWTTLMAVSIVLLFFIMGH